MYPRNLVLIRFDYVLQKDTDNLIDNLESRFGEPKNKVSGSDIRENIHRDFTFVNDDPHFGLASYESLSIRVIESTSAVTEIVSIARPSTRELMDIAFNSSPGGRQLKYSELKQDLEMVRTWIPGEEQGPETTIFWADVPKMPKQITSGTVSPVKVQTIFRDGIAHQFVSDFNVSANRGVVTLSNDLLLFLGEPDRMYGHLLAIDLTNRLSNQKNSPPSISALEFPDEFITLSNLYSIHYWCAIRGKEIRDIEERSEKAKSELPGGKSGQDPEDFIDLEPEIHSIQEEWTRLHGRIPGEERELKERLNSIEPDYDDTEFRSAPIDESGNRPGVLEAYFTSLERQLNEVRFDESQVDDILESLSNFTANQISAIGTRENIYLQRRVYLLTVLVAILTIVLTFDASMSGGLSTFVDVLLADGIEGISDQAKLGIHLSLLSLMAILGAKAIGGVILRCLTNLN